ncbi:hypothetical protein V7S43_002186 [Phytophthora oleae]|uniref:C2 domain-containing protein n=1 Tax=Phytophthora oleae TaxID=2107226 RepID=A0ABD3G338_9STRA
MARGSQESAPMSRFRAFTTSLGFKPSGGMSRSSSDQSSGPERPASMTSLRPLYGNFTLFLRVHSARNLPAVAQGSYCKLYLGDTPMIGGFGQGKSLVGADKRQGNSHQTFHTKVQMSATRDCTEWNEKFQMNVKNPNTEILTIRVKNHVLIYSPAIGACVVHLRQLQLGETVDEWFPLYRNDKPSGEIRLQICLQEKVAVQVPERKYSQPSEETIQRLMQEHRELEEAQRRELELQQQEKWRRMEEDAVKHVGLEQQVAREEKWREQNARRMDHDHPNQHEDNQEKELADHFKKEEDSDSDLPASFKYRGRKKEEKVILKQDMEEDKPGEVDFGIPSGYTIDRADSGNSYPSQLSEFATIRLSVEELEQVVQNALPTSDSTESERERRRHRDKKRRHRKKHSKRRTNRDESSNDSSYSSRYRKGSSRTKVSEGESHQKRSAQGSVSSQSEASTQNPEIPTTLTFPRSHSAESSPSEDSEDERRRRRRRRAERAKRRENERKRRSRRKHKGRRNYESSYSSSSLSSSSLSSSEEERLARKLKKKKEKSRAKLAESGDSRASTQSSGMHQPSYANSCTIDSVSPCVAQQWKPEHIDVVQVGGLQEDRNAHVAYAPPASSFVPSSDVHGHYGPDGVGFDEPDEPTATPQYLGQITKEQTNAELMRSFCF